MHLESCSFGAGSGNAPTGSILRARKSKRRKWNDVEMMVQKHGVYALVRKPPEQVLLWLL